MAKVRSYKLKVTQSMIDGAEPNDARRCLIANAIRLQIPNSYSVSVNDGWVRFNVGDHVEVTGDRYVYPLPGIALQGQRMLDDGLKHKIAPFPFVLQGSEGFAKPVEKTGPRAKPYRPRKKTKKTKRTRKATVTRCSVRRYRGLSVLTKDGIAV